MLYDEKHFKFFVDLIHVEPHSTSLINQYFLKGLPNNEKNRLTLDDYEVFYVRNMAYSSFIRKEMKSERYKISFQQYIEQEKVGLRKDISKYLTGKPLNERVEFLFLKLKDIEGLIDVSFESKYREIHTALSNIIISALIDVGVYFLEQYKKSFASDEYQYFHNYFCRRKSLIINNGIIEVIYNIINSNSKASQGSHRVIVEKKITPNKKNTHFNLRTTNKFNRSDRYAQVDNLFNALIDDFIECKKNDFRGVFGYGPVGQPIIWRRQINELKYLINRLIYRGFVDKPRNKWQVVIACFKLSGQELTTLQLQSNTRELGDKDPIDRLTAHI